MKDDGRERGGRTRKLVDANRASRQALPAKCQRALRWSSVFLRPCLGSCAAHLGRGLHHGRQSRRHWGQRATSIGGRGCRPGEPGSLWWAVLAIYGACEPVSCEFLSPNGRIRAERNGAGMNYCPKPAESRQLGYSSVLHGHRQCRL